MNKVARSKVRKLEDQLKELKKQGKAQGKAKGRGKGKARKPDQWLALEAQITEAKGKVIKGSMTNSVIDLLQVSSCESL